MQLLFVRHGESIGNVEGRMQGHMDFELSPRGREQAERLADWLLRHELRWDAAYCSPLLRARQTADLLEARTGWPRAADHADLKEIAAGSLEGLTLEDMMQTQPEFVRRPITALGDFGEFGGESYDRVQERVERVVEFVETHHRAPEHRVLIVAHGGINFQCVKRLVCEPVPRVCILRMGNCSATLVQLRERRGTYMGEIVWHVPLELMGGRTGEGSAAVFR